MHHDSYELVRDFALSFPGIVESTSYGTPSFKLKNKLLARLHEDGTTLVLKMDFDTRDLLMQLKPDVYYVTDHYMKYPYVLVKLDEVELEDLKDHLYTVWKANATNKMIRAYSLCDG